MALPEALENLRQLFLRRSCPGCDASLDSCEETVCRWCALRLEENTQPHRSSPDGGISVYSAYLHQGLARELVIRLKFSGERHLAGKAAALMAASPVPLPGPGSMVVPVPASRETRRSRGYNQAELLARSLARTAGAGFGRLLQREHREPQVGLAEDERRANIAGAFHLAGDPSGSGDVWLVDDVMTTGSTLHEASGVLLEGGAKDVRGLTLTYRSTSPVSII